MLIFPLASSNTQSESVKQFENKLIIIVHYKVVMPNSDFSF